MLQPCVCYGSRILRLLHFICVTFSSFCFCLLFRGFFSLSWFCCFTVAAFIFYFFCSLKQVCVTFLLPPGIKGLTCRRNKIKRLQYLEYVASPFFLENQILEFSVTRNFSKYLFTLPYDYLSKLKIYWRLSTILKTSSKSVWSFFFFFFFFF